jgi:uncharacterized membrane-anchored protein YhcB (DUF1043 family)
MRKGVVIMLNWGTAIWQLFNILILVGIVGLIFGILYYLIKSFKRQDRIEKKLDEIIERKKNN